MSVRPVGPWIRSASYVVLVGCAGMDSATSADVTPGPRFTLDPVSETVSQVLPAPPDEPGYVPGPCGSCALSCGAEQRCLGDVCTPRSDGVARPLAPESLGLVTSQRPTFRWVLPARVEGVRLQVCRDRLCRAVVQTADVVGETFRPEAPLAPGVYFWRVLARRGTFLSEKPTPVWEFAVGARDRGTDTVMDHLTDYNGDGYSDLALRLAEDRPVGVYLGGPEGLGLAPSARFALATGADVRAGFSPVGDLDGDGFIEALSVATRANDPAQRAVYLYHGGPQGLGAMPEQLPALAGSERWPDSFSSAGDLNGDGYGDLVGVDRERGDSPSRVRVFFGAPRGLQAMRGALLQGDPGAELGASISGGGDVNGDGRPDLLVGSPSAAQPGLAIVWVNRVGVCLQAETTRLWGDPGSASLFGRAVSVVGDFNGDGYGDPLVAEPYAAAVTGRSRAMLFQGGGFGVSTAPARTMPFGGAQTESIRLRAGADFNGDGYGDAVAWMHNEERGPSMSLFYGSPTGLPGEPSRMIRSSDLGSTETALSFAWTGDTDRDGYDDLALSLSPTEWLLLRGSAEGMRVVDGPRLELP